MPRMMRCRLILLCHGHTLFLAILQDLVQPETLSNKEQVVAAAATLKHVRAFSCGQLPSPWVYRVG